MERNLNEMAKACSPVRGQRLSQWLDRFLTAHPDQLARWNGTWTEVNTAKVVEIIRKRGCVEEHEANKSRFGQLLNACYRAPIVTTDSETKKSEKSEGEKGKQTITDPTTGEVIPIEITRRDDRRVISDGDDGPVVEIIRRNP